MFKIFLPIIVYFLITPSIGHCEKPFMLEQVIVPGSVFAENCELDLQMSDSFTPAVQDKVVVNPGQMMYFDLSYKNPFMLVKVRLKSDKQSAISELEFVKKSYLQLGIYEIEDTTLTENKAILIKQKGKIEHVYVQCNNVLTGFLFLSKNEKINSLVDAAKSYSSYLNRQYKL